MFFFHHVSCIRLIFYFISLLHLIVGFGDCCIRLQLFRVFGFILLLDWLFCVVGCNSYLFRDICCICFVISEIVFVFRSLLHPLVVFGNGCIRLKLFHSLDCIRLLVCCFFISICSVLVHSLAIS